MISRKCAQNLHETNIPVANSGDKNCGLKECIIILVLIFAAVVGSAGYLVFKALYDRQVPFLKSDGRADWILYPLANDMLARTKNYINMTAEFTKDFEPGSIPSNVQIHIRAFEAFSLRINDYEVFSNIGSGANWKQPTSVDITKHVKVGTNKIAVRVNCRYGPPSLWVYSENIVNLATDTTWQVGLSGGPAIAAISAEDTRVFHSYFDRFAPVRMFTQKGLALSFIFRDKRCGIFLVY